MISMSLEERLVMYIDVGTVTVRRRRYEFGARLMQFLFTSSPGCGKGTPI